METKKLSDEQEKKLKVPLPSEAVSPHPTKKFLSTIKAIYVVERLNDVFGIGAWRINCEVVEHAADSKMIVVATKFSVPDYGIELMAYGGNDNQDRGDAFKGAVTDAITKIGSWLGIGMDVFKGKGDKITDAVNAMGGETIKNPKHPMAKEAPMSEDEAFI